MRRVFRALGRFCSDARAFLLVSLLVAGCGGAHTQAPCPAVVPAHEPVRVILEGGDDAAATKKLAEFLSAHGFAIVAREENALGVQYQGISAVLVPKLDPGRGIDRIVVTRVFAPKEAYRGKPPVAELATKLNHRLNIAQFWVHENGNLMMTTHLTFLNELRLAWVAAFFDWLKANAAQMAAVVPETLEVLH